MPMQILNRAKGKDGPWDIDFLDVKTGDQGPWKASNLEPKKPTPLRRRRIQARGAAAEDTPRGHLCGEAQCLRDEP